MPQKRNFLSAVFETCCARQVPQVLVAQPHSSAGSTMGGDDKTNINHPYYEVKEGDPTFQEVWKSLPETSEAQRLVKKLCMADQRKLMVEEGTSRRTPHAAVNAVIPLGVLRADPPAVRCHLRRHVENGAFQRGIRPIQGDRTLREDDHRPHAAAQQGPPARAEGHGEAPRAREGGCFAGGRHASGLTAEKERQRGAAVVSGRV